MPFDDEPQFTEIITEELIFAQYHNKLCSDICRRFYEDKRLSLARDYNILIIRKVRINLQIFIPHWRKQRVLVLSHYLVTAGYPRRHKLYYHIKWHFYFPTQTLYCNATVQNSAEWDTNRVKPGSNVGSIRLFPAQDPL